MDTKTQKLIENNKGTHCKAMEQRWDEGDNDDVFCECFEI